MKVLIVHGGNCEVELKQARQWLEVERCEVAVFDFADSGTETRRSSLTELIGDCDSLVFLVGPALPLGEVQLAVLAANSKGKEVISVQLGTKIPIEAFEKYGSASVPFKQNLLVGAVCRNQFLWTDEDGALREDQEMEHHKCKKQKTGGKDAAA